MQTAHADWPVWSLTDIPYCEIELERIRHEEILFYLVTAASFIEIASDLYTRNLVEFFRDDPEVSQWLSQTWEHDELKHGETLRRYVQSVWKEFDWDSAYANFLNDYSRSCTIEEFERSQGLELAARCVVEMGTTSYYRALHDMSSEPVLRQITFNIRDDEVRHFKHFYRHFKRYRTHENLSRLEIVGALGRRLLELRNGDADCGIWHVFHASHPGTYRDGPEYKTQFSRVSRALNRHFPTNVAVKMFLKPLALPTPVQSLVEAPLTHVGQFLMLR